MGKDSLGDLREWGAVLEKLEAASTAGRIDDEQEGMARLLRYRRNWQLTEAALRYAGKVGRPDGVLVAEVLNLLTDQDAAVSERALAAGALGHFLSCPRPEGVRGSDFDLDRVVEVMSDVAERTAIPMLRQVVAATLRNARVR